jgi:hypothetical protein
VTVLHRRLPCGHQWTRHPLEHGTIRRICRVCKRAFLGTIVLSDASPHVGSEVLRVEWKEVTR